MPLPLGVGVETSGTELPPCGGGPYKKEPCIFFNELPTIIAYNKRAERGRYKQEEGSSWAKTGNSKLSINIRLTFCVE